MREEAGVQGQGPGRGRSRVIRASSQTPACACLPRDTNVRFSAELRRLQSLPKCQRLPLPSFLLLPFQRITRLRMLLQVPPRGLGPFRPHQPRWGTLPRGLLPRHRHFLPHQKHSKALS